MVGLVALFGSSLLRKSDLENHPKISAWVTENEHNLCRNVSEIVKSRYLEVKIQSRLCYLKVNFLVPENLLRDIGSLR